MLVNWCPSWQVDTSARICNEIDRRLRRRNAFQLFKESAEPNHRFNVIALIDQRDPLGSGWQRVKVVKSERGTVFKSVLSPLRVQGICSIDDGSLWTTLLPDERTVMIQKSPSGDKRQEADRMSLAKRNYSFSVVGLCRVAGRDCYTLTVEPKHRSLSAWIVYVDCLNTYPLRMDCQRDGVSEVQFISRAVTFPSKVEDAQLNLQIPEGFRSLRYDCPEHMPSAREAERRLGFVPVLPIATLPMGFRVQDMQLSKTNSWKSLVFRLTDGMARASVYEYLANSGGSTVKPFENSSVRTIGEVQLMLVSDVDRECRDRLLQCFNSKSP